MRPENDFYELPHLSAAWRLKLPFPKNRIESRAMIDAIAAHDKAALEGLDADWAREAAHAAYRRSLLQHEVRMHENKVSRARFG